MKIKKNDQVKILTGKDSGKTGKVLQILKNNQDAHLIVEGLNLRYKHLKPKKSGEKGQKIMFPAPLTISNVALVCPKCSQTTRIGFKKTDTKSELTKEKKQRICKKCQAII